MYTGLFGYVTCRLIIVQKVKEGVDCTRTTQGDLSAPEGLTEVRIGLAVAYHGDKRG